MILDWFRKCFSCSRRVGINYTLIKFSTLDFGDQKAYLCPRCAALLEYEEMDPDAEIVNMKETNGD